MDKLTKEQRRKNMQAVKNKNSKIENLVCNALWNRGIKYRRNVANLIGKPDIAIKKYKIVLFIDSCFWHKCPIHYKTPAVNTEFWDKKITGNMLRDKKVNTYYLMNNWNILRIWEHQLKNDFENTIDEITNFINNIKTK